MKSNSFFAGVFFLLVILAGCSRDDGVPVDESIAVNAPNSFASFLNPVAGLSAGDYTVVAATFDPGQAGNFSVTLTFDNGERQVFNDNWTDSVSMSQFSFNNPSFDFTLYAAGGIDIQLESSVDTYLYLIRRIPGVNGSMDRSGSLVRENNDISVLNTNSQITLRASRIDSESYGAAYYDTIDPGVDGIPGGGDGIKTTLQEFKDANGFDAANLAGRVLEPRFRDTKDLGYGRGVRAWTQPDGSLYFFVENFQVRSVPGLEYSTLNLNALLEDQRQHHFGTNAIEYSTYPYGVGEPCAFGSGAACATTNPDPPKFLKFYTFDATQGDQTKPDHANETRLNTVNLDGRGNKAMPGACVYCHGGELRPLRADTGRTDAYADGTYRDNAYDGTAGNAINGDTNAKFQLMEVSSFEFGDKSPYTKAEQEPIIKEVNKLVYCTYPGADPSACAEYCVDPADTVDCDGFGNDVATIVDNGTGTTTGEWSGAFAVEMAEGWYDDDPTTDAGADGIPDFDSPVFRQDYVPVGWRPDPSDGIPPPGADRLFVEVVQPACFVCHSRMGTNLGPNLSHAGKDIDYSSYEKFFSHADLIEEYVYELGIMPLSLRGYNAFWSGNQPATLASFLPNFSHLNTDGSISRPGSPVADAGPGRTSPSPVRIFGSNSRFVSKYNWSIVSTPVGGEDATLSEASTSSPVLTASLDGDYLIRLTVSNGLSKNSEDAVDTVIIKINSGLSPAPKDIVFSDIQAVFNNDCVSCHDVATSEPTVPVWWTSAQPATGTSLYEEVLARVDFNNPESSLLLRKPSGHFHHGNLRTGFEEENPANRQLYDLFLNWIVEGAREN